MADTVKITSADITRGMTIKLKVARDFSLRIKLGAWLIGVAGRVMNIPCEIEMVIDEIKAGDVVRDRFNTRMMTVEYVHGDMLHCVWFERDALYRNTVKRTDVEKVAD